MKISSMSRIEPLFFGLPALRLSNILSALSGLAFNYRIGNLGKNPVKASVINISPLCII